MLRDLADSDNLHGAWHAVRRKNSAPGVDGVTVDHFSRDASARLRRLRQDLLKETYRPLPLRGSFIPKATEGWRTIGIPTVRDRVAQRACLNVLTPVLEPEFEACSYAYREGRSIYQAIAQVERWRDKGNRVLLDADIKDCFDSIDRNLLLDLLQQYVRDQAVIALVRLWLEAGVQWGRGERESGGKGAGSAVVAPVGIPQGDIISPVLCNVFLDEFDEALLGRRFKLVRYADDFLVLTTNRDRAEEALVTSRQALAELGLSLNRGKTRITTFEDGFKYLGTIFAGDLALPTVRQERINARGEEEIIFVPGYPSAPWRPVRRRGEKASGQEGAEGPPLPDKASGIVSVSTQVAVARNWGKSATAMGLAMRQALEEKQRSERKKLKREAGQPWETTFLV